jgi:hypothetical protein
MPDPTDIRLRELLRTRCERLDDTLEDLGTRGGLEDHEALFDETDEDDDEDERT